MDNIKRRSFLKNSSILTGSLVLPSFAFKKQKQLDKKLKISVVGCGGRGTGAAVQALRADKNVELVALSDAFEDRLEKSLNAIIEEFDGEMEIKVKDKNKFIGFNGYKKAIDLADVVILASPPGFRPEHFEYAVNKNKHIFMEKPVATDAAGVRKILNAAKLVKEKKLNVVVGLQRRYQLSYLDIFKQVKRGIIGRIISGTVRWNSSGVWVNKRKPGQSELEYQMRNWYYFNWICGDHIVEQHIHNLDVANWFLGEHPVTAQGMGGREVRKGIDHGEIFDHHYVEFKYPSGAVIHSQCRHQPGTVRNVNELLVGTKGVVNLSGNGVVKINDHNGNLLHKYNPKNDLSPYQIEHNKLFKSIRSKRQIDDTEIGAIATMTAIMGRMATYSGKLIEWENALNADQKLVPENIDWDSKPPVTPNKNGYYKIPVPGK